MRNVLLTVCAFSFAACTSPAADPISSEALLADPEAFLGEEILVEGSVFWPGFCNAAACEAPGPCNNCVGPLAFGGDDDYIPIAPAEDWEGPLAQGVLTQDCYGSEMCLSGAAIGCHGNDDESVCAPAVPARVTAVRGVLTRDELGQLSFVASEIELADGPTEQTIEWTPNGIHLIEAE